MKIKLSRDEALYVCGALADEVDIDLFDTQFEYEITTLVLKRFINRLAKREYPQNNKQSSIKLEQIETVALNKVLPFIWTNDPYSNTLINLLTQDINQECVRINIS